MWDGTRWITLKGLFPATKQRRYYDNRRVSATDNRSGCVAKDSIWVVWAGFETQGPLFSNMHDPVKNTTLKQREAAQHAVSRAVKKGILKKPDRCERCGITGRIFKLVAHHTNYEDPLNVIWLCVSCHKEMHVYKKVKRHAKEVAASRNLTGGI